MTHINALSEETKVLQETSIPPLGEQAQAVLDDMTLEEYVSAMNAYLRANNMLEIHFIGEFDTVAASLNPLAIVERDRCICVADSYFVVLHDGCFVGYDSIESIPSYTTSDVLADYVERTQDDLGNPALKGTIDEFNIAENIEEITEALNEMASESAQTAFNQYIESLSQTKYRIYSMTEIYSALKLWEADHITTLVKEKPGTIDLNHAYFVVRDNLVDSSDKAIELLTEDEISDLAHWILANKEDCGIYELARILERISKQED